MIDPLALPGDAPAEGLLYGRVYWTDGPVDDRNARFRSEVKTPPCNGWQGAFVLDKGGKSVTIFCPHTFQAYNVTRKSAEFALMVPKPIDAGFYEKHLPKRWAEIVRYGWARDFDVAAAVMRLLYLEVPLSTRAEDDPANAKVRGGSEVSVKLARPVKKDGRRGQILAFFLQGRRSLLEAMAEIGVTRNNILSQLYMLKKEHGIGYAIIGDSAEIQLPEGCADPFC